MPKTVMTRQINRMACVFLAAAIALLARTAPAASAVNAYVIVSSETHGVSGIFVDGADFYVMTRGVNAPVFSADIGVVARSPHVIALPSGGRARLGIGGSGDYKVVDESGLEDWFAGKISVLKLDIEPNETNICRSATSCTLRLTSDSVPGGNAVWSSSPLGISGSGHALTFNPSSLAAGTYLVNARSAIVPGYEDSCIVRIYDLISETVSPVPSNRERTLLGVGEEVNVMVSPSSGSASWAIDGDGTIVPMSGYATCVTAPSIASEFTVRCSVRGLALTKTFSVVEPNGVVDAAFLAEIPIPEGTSGAGMKLYPIVVGPKTVSFYNVKCVEVGKDAVNATGYWTANTPPSHVGNGADEWFPLDYGNKWPPEWDVAYIIGIQPPWLGGGSFEWPIPAKWTVSESGVEKEMQGWNQRFELEDDGTVTVRKFGKWIRRTVGGISTHGGD